jgi:hypothetical protein
MAGIVNFTPIQTNDRTLQLMQNQISSVVGSLTSNPLASGILKSISFTKADSDVLVVHGLGSMKISFWAIGLNFPASVFISPNWPAKANNNQLILQCETSRTISSSSPLTGYVYVFLVN